MHISTATKNEIARIFDSVHSPAYSRVAFITNQRLIVSVEHREVVREIFKAIIIAQFVTPSESRVCEKTISRNAQQVCSPLISLLLGDAGAYVRI